MAASSASVISQQGGDRKENARSKMSKFTSTRNEKEDKKEAMIGIYGGLVQDETETYHPSTSYTLPHHRRVRNPSRNQTHQALDTSKQQRKPAYRQGSQPPESKPVVQSESGSREPKLVAGRAPQLELTFKSGSVSKNYKPGSRQESEPPPGPVPNVRSESLPEPQLPLPVIRLAKASQPSKPILKSDSASHQHKPTPQQRTRPPESFTQSESASRQLQSTNRQETQPLVGSTTQSEQGPSEPTPSESKQQLSGSTSASLSPSLPSRTESEIRVRRRQLLQTETIMEQAQSVSELLRKPEILTTRCSVPLKRVPEAELKKWSSPSREVEKVEDDDDEYESLIRSNQPRSKALPWRLDSADNEYDFFGNEETVPPKKLKMREVRQETDRKSSPFPKSVTSGSGSRTRRRNGSLAYSIRHEPLFTDQNSQCVPRKLDLQAVNRNPAQLRASNRTRKPANRKEYPDIPSDEDEDIRIAIKRSEEDLDKENQLQAEAEKLPNPLSAVPITQAMKDEVLKELRRKKEEKVITKFTLTILQSHLAVFDRQDWLEDRNIDFYLEMIRDRNDRLRAKGATNYPSVFIFHSFVFSLIYRQGVSEVVATKENIFEYDLAFFPVHIRDHWTLIVADFRERSLLCYDSLFRLNDKYLAAILKYLKFQYIATFGMNSSALENQPAVQISQVTTEPYIAPEAFSSSTSNKNEMEAEITPEAVFSDTSPEIGAETIPKVVSNDTSPGTEIISEAVPNDASLEAASATTNFMDISETQTPKRGSIETLDEMTIIPATPEPNATEVGEEDGAGSEISEADTIPIGNPHDQELDDIEMETVLGVGDVAASFPPAPAAAICQIFPSCNVYFEDWNVNTVDPDDTKIPLQKNGFDCGVFVCQYAESLARGKQPPFDFTQRNMLYFRHLMAYETIKGCLCDRLDPPAPSAPSL